ncbi:hypothetical protein ES702_05358 [subsurface metagenome]
MGSIAYDSNSFIINGKRMPLIIATIHYFRIPHQLWRDRILKAKRAGFNTIETYIPWNLYETDEGKYDKFKGDKDIEHFFSISEELDMYIMVRPGPYICAEWDMAGLPAWLNSKEGLELRTNNPVYLKYVDRWFDILIPVIAKHQVTRDGNVILVQAENEYEFRNRPGGKEYLEYLRDGLRKRGIEVPITACNDFSYPIKGVIETANCSINPEKFLERYRKSQPDAPPLVSEFWVGWVDCWGGVHRYADVDEIVYALKEIIASGASYDCYTFCGGTNFGFWGGRGLWGDHGFVTTSYGCNGILSETGGMTTKYYKVKLLNQFVQTFSSFLTQAEITKERSEPDKQLRTITHRVKDSSIIFHVKERKGLEKDIRPVLVNYELKPDIRISFADSNILLLEEMGEKLYILVYGKPGERGKFVLKLSKKPRIDGKAIYQWDKTKKELSINFEYPKAMERIDLKIKTQDVIHLIITNENLAERGWVIAANDTKLLLLGPNFVGEPTNDSLPLLTDGEKVISYSLKCPEGKELVVKEMQKPKELPSFPKWRYYDQIEEINGEVDLATWQKIGRAQAMEDIGCNQGYGWYRTEFHSEKDLSSRIFFTGATDRLKLFLNGEYLGTWGRLASLAPLPMNLRNGKNTLSILVDNLGRHIDGIMQTEKKGIYGPVYINARKEELKNSWALHPGSGQPAERIGYEYSILGDDLEVSKEFIWANTEFDIGENEGATLSYREIHIPNWIYVNDKLLRYSTKDHQTCGYGNFEISKYLHQGRNTIKFCFEGLVETRIVDKILLITYPLDKSLSGPWFFHKGINEDEITEVKGWKDFDKKKFRQRSNPIWWRANFTLDTIFYPIRIAMEGMGKGQIYLNGHNIGRYWQIGPQKEYYLPETWLKNNNELVIFDEEGKIPQEVRLVYDKDWNKLYSAKVKLNEV